MPVIVACRISLLRAPGTERPFRTGFCAKSAFPGAVEIRNDTAAPRRRFGNFRRLVSTSFRPERAKEDTAGEAQLFYLCRARVSARFRHVAHFCRLGTNLCRPFSPRVLRSEFSDSRGWIRLGLACTFPVSAPRFVKPRARWSGKRSRELRCQRLLLPGRDPF